MFNLFNKKINHIYSFTYPGCKSKIAFRQYGDNMNDEFIRHMVGGFILYER